MNEYDSNKDVSDLKIWKENSQFPKKEKFTKERVILLLEKLWLKIDW